MSGFRTVLDRLKYPILQAPMAGVQDDALAIAVSAAGALGALPAGMLGNDQLAAALRRVRQRTMAPFQVNFFCHPEPVPDPVAAARWTARLETYRLELGLPQVPGAAGPSRRPFAAAHLAVLQDCPPDVVSFHFGLPDTGLLTALREMGIRSVSTATTVEEGLYLAERGVDGIIAQGLEAGGHRGMFLRDDLSGQTDTLSLVRALVERTQVPIIAAGGIVDAAAVCAALSAGAAAVQAGTAFLCCDEATTSAVHRAALARRPIPQTRLTRLFSGRLARGLVNRLMQELAEDESLAPAFPLASGVLAPLRAAAERAGRDDFTPLWCGTRAEGIRAVSAQAVIHALADGI